MSTNIRLALPSPNQSSASAERDGRERVKHRGGASPAESSDARRGGDARLAARQREPDRVTLHSTFSELAGALEQHAAPEPFPEGHHGATKRSGREAHCGFSRAISQASASPETAAFMR